MVLGIMALTQMSYVFASDSSPSGSLVGSDAVFHNCETWLATLDPSPAPNITTVAYIPVSPFLSTPTVGLSCSDKDFFSVTNVNVTLILNRLRQNQES